MQKISVTAQLAAYAASMLLGLGTFGAWNYLSVPDAVQTADIPVINLASLDLGIESASGVAHAANANPFGDISMAAKAGAGIAAAGMGMPQGITPPTPPGVPAMPSAGEMQGGTVTVLGVLPPDVVIISRGGKSITARSGESTEFGTVGSVNMKGAYIDGAFVELH